MTPILDCRLVSPPPNIIYTKCFHNIMLSLNNIGNGVDMLWVHMLISQANTCIFSEFMRLIMCKSYSLPGHLYRDIWWIEEYLNIICSRVLQGGDNWLVTEWTRTMGQLCPWFFLPLYIDYIYSIYCISSILMSSIK